MPHWPDTRLADRLGIVHPILLAPMAGAAGPELAIAVARAGGLGALPCAMLDADTIHRQVAAYRAAVQAPLNLNFFCHASPPPDAAREARWRERLAPYYAELALEPDAAAPVSQRTPFDAALCALVESLRPEVVSFHFGLPAAGLLDRVKASGALVIASATTVAEAVWLAARGCDAIIAQGAEAGGHRGMFLADEASTQVGLFSLLPQVADAVSVPVIAAGGVADARGIVAALALGAAAVQIGTAYLLSEEARISPLHRAALQSPRAAETAITNLFTGRPARGIVNRLMRELGPINDAAPAFPTAGNALAPLRTRACALGSDDFIALWAGQSAPLARALPAEALTRQLAAQALDRLQACVSKRDEGGIHH